TNSSSDHPREASRTCAATDVPERSNCFPKTLTSSRAFDSLTYNRIAVAAKAFVRFLNSTGNLPWFIISTFPISVLCFPPLAFCFLLSKFLLFTPQCSPQCHAPVARNWGRKNSPVRTALFFPSATLSLSRKQFRAGLTGQRRFPASRFAILRGWHRVGFQSPECRRPSLQDKQSQSLHPGRASQTHRPDGSGRLFLSRKYIRQRRRGRERRVARLFVQVSSGHRPRRKSNRKVLEFPIR